ncbi:MAG: ribose 5-phosphate isomerase B [Myxococcales bacterium]|jgi:ribose 5-phosphate isomerase B|nr:MAG: ribose 5-phosphate isomerase B [Myxococcales bacterium]
MAKTLIVGSDHAGLELKRELSGVAAELGYEVVDIGTHSADSTDYPDYAHQVASAVAAGEGLGLLVCGTGLGMSMAANRHPGVRAAMCGDVFSASMSRQHNDANVLCIGARVVGAGLAAEIVKAFLTASFEGGRHERRVHKIEPSHEG